jgi:hypothetical protein
MGKRSRFLNITYLINTFYIKSKALGLEFLRGSYPFEYYKNKIQVIPEYSYQLNFHPEYQSLSYLSFENAQKYHTGNRSITQELIIALCYSNECLTNNNLDLEYLIKLATSIQEKAIISESSMIFFLEKPYDRFDLTGKYYSGIVQGKAASLFLRCFIITKDKKYKEWARKCLTSCMKSISEGGVLVSLPNKNIWVEEYPSPKPSMVLNGFLFYIIGLAEYMGLDEDLELREILESCLKSVLVWMPNYKIKNDLLYSMYRWNLCNVHYTAIMKYQFEHLYNLTMIPIFKEYMDFTHEITDWNTFEKII